ncbi:Tetratricopeptide repeat (TPR)-like superfamily protein isoform 1 [Hibiscus syriacus]|uniref:Tetratricopeptide repeat (TPR)-like superfamily protein isoform 1 n=2 Tax=Hibiscus syriacus TaxID=106335 RepID=A0A6A3D881_HIBSY|nr:Tetratricopeptide repeat (TPR)-like superfamily protein isoform 1 [Hibiscus syriacus]
MDKGNEISHRICDERKMWTIHKSLTFNGILLSSHLPVTRTDSRFVTKLSKRKDTVCPSSSNDRFPKFKLGVSNTVLARSLVGLFGLGFIDAGYSGDWSRIGVISKDAEDLLKIAAFVVVPVCVFLVISFSKEPADS